MVDTPNIPPAPAELPHHSIEGLDGRQADRFVELAYANNELAEAASSTDWLEADQAAAEMRINNDQLRRLANIAAGRPEVTPVPEPSEEASAARRNPPQVVNPADGRIVPYGQMQHGNHPYGGMIVRR